MELDSNTMALWHFNEGSGIITYDETINNNDGDLNGPTWTTGKFDGALNYNGGNDRVDVSTDPSLNFGAQQSFTIETWVKTGLINQNIICKYVDGTPGYYQLYTMSLGLLQFKIGCTNGIINRLYSNTVIADNNWHYIAAVRDTSKDLLLLYVDGVLSSLCIDSTTGSISTPGPLYIGKYVGGSSFGFNGKIDEIRISNNARSPWEIAQNYGLFKNTANLTTKPINLPLNMHWDTLIINKTKPENTYLNITILNASNNQQIPGTPKFIDGGEFDISYIDPIQYPSIRLNATFRGNGSTSPNLFYWFVSWNATNAWRDSFFSVSKSSAQNLTRNEGEIWASPSTSEWVKYSANPILPVSSSGWDDYGTAKCSVIYNGSGYMMWYEGRPGSIGWEIGLATSQDGIQWTKYSGNPVLKMGTGGSWEDLCLSGPTVIFDGNTYKMWYMGESSSISWKIGYATSSDGINWIKYPGNPVLVQGAGGSWDEKYVGFPSIYFDGIKFTMWYSGGDINDNRKIGIATSYDGINWIKYQNNPIMAGSGGNNVGVGGLNVIRDGNQFLGWYYNRATNFYMINHASSIDGINWKNSSNNPVLLPSSAGWDSNDVLHPAIISKNKQFYMYYQGASGVTSQIGLAKSKFIRPGIINSTIIDIPEKCYYDDLIINKVEPPATYINVTILDGVTNQPILPFINLRSMGINISSINPHLHPSIRLQANFDSNDINTPILYDWSVNWTQNAPPILLEFQSSSNSVYRTNTIQFVINVSDIEDTCNNLTVDIKYRSTTGTIWLDSYLNDLRYEGNYWVVNFTPSKNAELGEYSFNVSCNDTFQEFDNRIFYDVITVLNNLPTQPDVMITPAMPKTMDDLIIVVTNVTDIEDETITYYCEWYKDSELQLGLKTELVPSSNTAQNEVWKCIVTPNDGNENGTAGEAEAIIQNTPPEINNSLLSVTFYEDTIDYSLNLSYTFKDSDYDELEFEFYGNDKLDVNIFENGTVELIPEPDWFGSETLTIFANDSLAEVSDTVLVKVLPTNDEPVLIEIVGPKNIYLPSKLIEIRTDEDEWLNLTVNAYDIDGDTLTYSTNRTDNIGTDDLNNLFIEGNIISYLPTNDDVGFLTINVTVSDNNGSKIYQNLELEIRNTNDPPAVKIKYPSEGSQFKTTDFINFTCEWSDIDFNVPEPTERLEFTWFTNHTKSRIGQGESLINITLEAGYHQITLEVKDDDGLNASDSINITIKSPPPPQDTGKVKTETEDLWWVILIIVIIIVMILIIGFIVIKRKKQAAEAEKAAAAEPEALIPEIVTKPEGEPLLAAPTVAASQQLTPSVIPTPVVQAPAPAPVLAGVQPGVTPSLPPAQVEAKEELSNDEKLKLLEERLIKGDIDQELYETLKQKIESEPEGASPITVEAPESTIEEKPVTAPASIPKLKTPLTPKIVTPEIKSEEKPQEGGVEPSQIAEQPSVQEERSEESAVESPEAVCPQCQSSAIVSYPDGSSSCSSCGHKWL
ncbi:MAG: hypothetical protein KAJ51_01255 [Thermoplasmata archaeon]|nr:hypothetical protein [Thermoplasmata archaeon]